VERIFGLKSEEKKVPERNVTSNFMMFAFSCLVSLRNVGVAPNRNTLFVPTNDR
jgi:hypothetical protein